MISNSTRLDVGALRFDAISKDDLLLKLRSSIGINESFLIYTPNLQFQRGARINPEVANLIDRADLVVCDSRFIQLVANVRSQTKLDRIAGASVLEWLLALSSSEDISIAVIGGQQEAHDLLSLRLEREFEGRVRASFTSRKFPAIPSEQDIEFCLDFLKDARADFIIYALGFPKQERLAWEMRKRNVRGLHLCLGAAVDYSAGLKKRSPQFLQTLGMEWLWRLLSEPKRLVRRYIFEGVPEALRLILGILKP